ncbi:maleylpyruvate isomerase family mycothiol-dependent enzyme [Streptomyces sp. HUAS MG47]|uniref:maleylpyruvate isomerase family mycothiol-dependent enzyme n=1 Tax=Streptomyces solicamelliae TaxID=3231716 RepID=UPI003877A4D5
MEPILSVAEQVTALDASGRALAAAAAEAGFDATVPTCPGWQVRDLLRHTAMVHRWAAGFVTEGHTSYRPEGGETQLDGAELLAYFREGHAALVDALGKAPADLECWTFLPAPSPLAFWARRQAHETEVHRADAESALPGGPRPVAAGLAVDGVDELLRAFHGRSYSRVRSETPRVLRVRATDTGDVWTVRLSPDAAPDTVRDDDGPADCTLSGPASQLYLLLWNRLPADAVDVSGDASLAALWREHSAITWS